MEKPFWVEIGLLGITNRSKALAWFYSSLVGAILLGVITFGAFLRILDSPLSLAVFFSVLCGACFALSSLWYWLCIKWMDNNGGWLK